MKHLVREYRLSHGKHGVIVHVFKSYKEFIGAMKKFGGVGSGLQARYMHLANMPRTGGQGVIAIPTRYLSVETLAHEFMHLCVNMAKKNKEERAVIVSSHLLIAAVNAIKKDGFKLPLQERA